MDHRVIPSSQMDTPSLSAAAQPSAVQVEASSIGCMSVERPKRRPSAIKKLSMQRSSGGGQCHYFATAISLSATITAIAAANGVQQQRRKLEDNGDDYWTGEWDGSWTAATDYATAYQCDGDDCNDDASRAHDDMWIDNDQSISWATPDEIITYVSIGILGFMTLLCCVCYPEILMFGWNKMCGCCVRGGGAAKGTGVSAAAVGNDEVEGGDYVGGRQEEEDEGKKKKKKRSSRSRSGSRKGSRRSDVELV